MQKRGVVKYKLHHILFWILVFGFWYYLRFQDYATREIAFQVTLLKVTDLAVLVYITNYLLIPRILYKRRYVIFGAVFLLMIMASAVVKVFVLGKILHQPQLYSLSGDLKIRFYENVISDFFLVVAGAAFRLIFDYIGMQQRLAEVAREKAETELNFLKSQINPHFLFNSLNAVYFLIHKDNTVAREALHTFSEMLRYQLYEVNGDRIPVEREITYLKDYVDLQQLRKDEKFSVQFNCAPDIGGFLIEPLLLIPFVENAFKHISHFNDQNNFVKMDMNLDNGTFRFTIENSKEPESMQHVKKGGIGLTNVKRRLELLYPGRHELDIEETENLFKVKLNLQVT